MRLINFTQKLLRQRRFLSSLIPLLALFVGLGASQSALAQALQGASTATIRNVVVTAGTSAATATTNIYDAIPTAGGTGIGGGIFAGTNFGSIDVATGRLLLQGGTVEVTETAGEVYNRAFINFGVAQGTTAPTPAPGLTQSIELVETGFAGGVRTFTLTNAARNLLVFATTAGAGTSYRFDITVNATGFNTGGDDIFTAGSGARRRSIFNATGTPSTASVSANTISIAPNGGANVVYNINPPSPRPFNGANLSDPNNGGTSYDVNNGQLRLNGTTVTTTEAGGNTISDVILYYRVRLASSAGGAYQPLTLTQSGNTMNGVRTFILDPSRAGANPRPNLIAAAAVTAAGTYTLDVYYQANGVNAGIPFTITDPPGAPISAPYSANFTVSGTPFGQTVWTGGLNDNWFDTRNWSNGVPNENLSALVPDLGSGVAVPYPNINSDSEKLTASGTVLYSNLGSGPARARNLIMGGTSQASRSITRLEQGQLQVYGNFDNTYDSFIQRENSTIAFAGTNQNITGGTFFRVDIAGGGTKTLAGVMTIQTSLNFLTGVTTGSEPAVVNTAIPSAVNAGILTTDITFPTVSVVVLSDRTVFNANNGAQLTGETDASFLFGFVRTSRANVLVNEARTYGNIGLQITFTGANNPGNVDITRNTVEAYSPVLGRFGIRRIWGVRPSDPQTTSGGLIANMVFRYRDAETMNINGPNTITPGPGSIPESRLVAFVSSNSGNTFGFLGRDGAVDIVNNLVTKLNVRQFATFTLGDQQNPLPVRLTAFDATRIGADALVTWQTASEINSRGYDVQVSTNGTEFRTLTSVPSAAPNTVRLTSYSYLDTEKNKSGVRYYRLRQVDLDGKEEFFAPKTVSFEGKAPATTLAAYPNPFNSNDQLHLAIQSIATGKGQVRITDMTGRVVRQESVEINKGLTDLEVNGLADLKSGLYVVNVTLPTGETKNLKIVKQ